MGRVIAIGPGGRAQAPERRDVCRPVIEFVIEHGLLDQKLLSPICTTLAKADRLAKDLYLSARYFCSCGRAYCTRKHKNTPPDNGCPDGGQRVSCRADPVLWTNPKTGLKHYRVQFRMFDKRESMRAVVARYGPDPKDWPYFAKRE